MVVALAVVGLSLTTLADVMDRPQGIKFGSRMTLKPYLGLSYTYDSNIHSTRRRTASSIYHINPNVDLIYLGDNWSLMGGAWYKYNAYSCRPKYNNTDSYGEKLKFDWSDSKADEAGWRVLLVERWEHISQDDDMNGGRGVGRDRSELTADGTIERRLNQYWHVAVVGNYYKIDYDNNAAKYVDDYYGWRRVVLGGEAGYAPTKWTDYIVHADYQWYDQDNVKGTNLRSDSRGVTVMGGLATHATEKITYRLLGGWSRFEYANGGHDINGFTYQGSANWQATSTLNFMVLASSYYQPSEYEVGTANRVDALSAGFGKSLVRGKVNFTGDLAFRNEKREYCYVAAPSYERQYWTARIGVNYIINRFVTAFSNFEYQTCNSSGRFSAASNAKYDYDRFRFTIGLRLTY